MSLATTIFGKLASFGFGFYKRGKQWEKFNSIVNKYDLEMCDDEDELMAKFNRMESEDRVYFLKMMPDFFEYVEHARNYPGTPYYRQPSVYFD
jgi:hypothetical protein